jgi:adenine-specific DNA-methyltransferase
MKNEGTMKKLTANEPETKSPDLVAENLERLKALFPELVTEGPDGAAVQVEVLKQLVGDKTVTDADEKYGLNWHGKRRARQLALTPSTGTLRPCPEDSVDWDTTQNLMIEGDNLEVLKLLQKSYAGKVKLIYIDPPYNNGDDRVYLDDFQDSIANYKMLTGQVDSDGRILVSNTEASGRFHTNWLNMMYPRLLAAKLLLSPDGVLLVSIDDDEVASLRSLCDQVFGEECRICLFTWVKKRKGSHLSDTHRSMTEFVVAYARNKEGLSLFGEDAYSEKLQPLAKKTNSPKPLRFSHGAVQTSLKDGKYRAGEYGEGGSSLQFQVDFEVVGGKVIGELLVEGPFVWTQDKLDNELRLGTTVHLSSKYGFNVGRHDQSEKYKAPSTLIMGEGTNEDAFEEQTGLFGVERVFAFAKPVSLLNYLINAVTFQTKTGVVLDFFAGSGTTGHALMAQNAADGGKRRCILVQLPEPLDPENKDQKIAAEFCKKLKKPLNIAELTKERLRRAVKKIKKENPMYSGDLGFRVFKLDSSNIRAWEPARDDLDRTLLDHKEHLKADRSESDILYELLLKLGLDLCVPIESRTIARKAVHSIGGGVLLACLATQITRDEVEALTQGIVAWHNDLAPAGDTICVFRDSAFADDVAKTNLAAILNQHGLTNVRSL